MSPVTPERIRHINLHTGEARREHHLEQNVCFGKLGRLLPGLIVLRK